MEYTLSSLVAITLLAALGQVASEWIPDPMCPSYTDDFTYYPSLEDCSQYWVCFSGKKELMNCPSQFYWNTVGSYCDYKNNVDCNQNRASTTPGPITTPRPTPSTTVRATTKPAPITTTTTPPTPPPGSTSCKDDANDGHFFRDPDDCSKYYECNKGQTIVGQCPAGTLWNEDILTCDFDWDVRC